MFALMMFFMYYFFKMVWCSDFTKATRAAATVCVQLCAFNFTSRRTK